MATQKKSKIRKEQILKAAERIFARKGFQDATISDVARKAGVSDATIYEYFQSKEDLLFSIPGETAKSGKENLSFHLNYVRGAANKIHSIIYHYTWFYENHPDYASVVLLILKQNRKFLETDAYRDVRELSRLILDVIKEGMDSGEFKPDTDPYLIRSVILGTIEHQVIRWILLGKPESITGIAGALTDLIIGGIQREPKQRGWNLNIALTPGKEAIIEQDPQARRTKKNDAKEV